MFRKQDSSFWWSMDDYVKDDPGFKNLTIEQKQLIDKGYQLAYYGLFQYELYIGRGLNEIDSTKHQEIIDYILKNFDRLMKAIALENEDEDVFKLGENKEFFQKALEKIILPYINDHSFGTIDSYSPSSESLKMITMQLAFKNQYDINYINKTETNRVYYSQLYPFLITVLLIDPTVPDMMYDRAKNFFTKEKIEAAYNDGRMITPDEREYLFSSMDRLRNADDFQAFLKDFNKERWELLDFTGRFRTVFQLSKLTAILLKKNINSITFMGDGEEIYDLLRYYFPLVLQSADEYENWRDALSEEEKQESFLYPISFKDFDSRTIKSYFTKMHLGKIKVDHKKLTAFRIGITFSTSKLRLIATLMQESDTLRNAFVEKFRIALVNSLHIFDDIDGKIKEIAPFVYKWNDLPFLDETTLQTILTKLGRKKEDKDTLETKLKPVMRTISYLIAIDPSIVKTMNYSLEEIVKYYLVCLGPYKKTKIGYDKSDIKDLTDIIEKNARNLKSKEQEPDFYQTYYLINKLINFKPKKRR